MTTAYQKDLARKAMLPLRLEPQFRAFRDLVVDLVAEALREQHLLGLGQHEAFASIKAQLEELTSSLEGNAEEAGDVRGDLSELEETVTGLRDRIEKLENASKPAEGGKE